MITKDVKPFSPVFYPPYLCRIFSQRISLSRWLLLEYLLTETILTYQFLKKNLSDLQRLFNGERPSVRRFLASIQSFPTEKQAHFYQLAYQLALVAWPQLPKWYQTFLYNLICHDRQRFLDFQRRETVLGLLLHTPNDPQAFIKMIHLLEPYQGRNNPSFNHLSFLLLQSFDIPYKISTLGDKIRTANFYPEELLELLGTAEVVC
jgi:hypothetical protein